MYISTLSWQFVAILHFGQLELFVHFITIRRELICEACSRCIGTAQTDRCGIKVLRELLESRQLFTLLNCSCGTCCHIPIGLEQSILNKPTVFTKIHAKTAILTHTSVSLTVQGLESGKNNSTLLFKTPAHYNRLHLHEPL